MLEQSNVPGYCERSFNVDNVQLLCLSLISYVNL